MARTISRSLKRELLFWHLMFLQGFMPITMGKAQEENIFPQLTGIIKIKVTWVSSFQRLK
jgi:hypothetical protein